MTLFFKPLGFFITLLYHYHKFLLSYCTFDYSYLIGRNSNRDPCTHVSICILGHARKWIYLLSSDDHMKGARGKSRVSGFDQPLFPLLALYI